MKKITTYNSQIEYLPKKYLKVDFRNQQLRRLQIGLLVLGILAMVYGLISLLMLTSYIILSVLMFVFGILISVVMMNISINRGFILDYGKIDYLKFGRLNVSGRFIKYSPFLDIKIKVLSKGIKVTFLDMTFKLDSAKDLPILTDAIVELLDLTFYENYQLTNKTEILTYRGNRVVQPIFPSLLQLERTRQRIKCIDIVGEQHLITVDNFSTQSNKLWIGKWSRKIFTKDIKRITICFQPIFWGIWSLIWIRLEKKHQPSKFKFIAFFQRLFNQRFAITGLRKRKDELTNIRDAQEVFSHLSLLDSLKPVEIVKR